MLHNTRLYLCMKRLQKLAAATGCCFEADEKTRCLRYSAPPGKCFEPGLSTIIVAWGQDYNGWTRGQAASVLLECAKAVKPRRIRKPLVKRR